MYSLFILSIVYIFYFILFVFFYLCLSVCLSFFMFVQLFGIFWHISFDICAKFVLHFIDWNDVLNALWFRCVNNVDALKVYGIYS